MTRPILYYVRHGQTDWNVVQRLQGRRDVPINATGRSQGTHCGHVLRDLFERDARTAAELGYVSSPLRRARETMELMRATLALPPDSYSIEERLIEISFGEWEGLTLAEVQSRDAAALAERERDKWSFTPPGGESYAAMAKRVGAWEASVTRDTVISAHGGVARALIAHLGIMAPEEAPLADIENGVVYVFAGATMTRYT
jgi:probable phosphoglycerate mutase